MARSTQKIEMGVLSQNWKEQLSKLEKSRAVERLWQRDLSLWPSNDSRKAPSRELLGWLDLADHLEATSVPISLLGDSLQSAGFTDAVFLAFSSSYLAADLIASLKLATRGARFHVLGSMESSGLRALERQLDLKRTVFLVASKSGKNLEVHALLLYFLAKIKAAGVSSPGSNFIAITEEGSYLAVLGHQDRFRAVLSEPHGFRGRFSGVVHYGHLLVGLCQFNIHEVLASVREMRERCISPSPIDQNPAAALAAFLLSIAQNGFHRLLFRCSPELIPFVRRLGHLVGSSSCKDGKGILPFLEFQSADNNEILNKGCAVCEVRLAGEKSSQERQSEYPLLSVEIPSVGDIPAEVLKWEIATCLACSVLGVDPFTDPDFMDGRQAAIDYIEQIAVHDKLEISRPRILEGNLSLFVEGELRHGISTLNLEQALVSFFALSSQNSYLAVLNYLWDLPEFEERLRDLTIRLAYHLGLPAHLAPGPRYLHLSGQCYKGGPSSGLALMLTCNSPERIEIPGAGYSFDDLRFVLALGDADAMTNRGRPIVRLHLAGPPQQALEELESLMEKVMKSVRRKG